MLEAKITHKRPEKSQLTTAEIAAKRDEELPSHARSGPARGLWLVDADDYDTVQEAVAAALELADTYQCPDCGVKLYTRPMHCRECGSRESFIKLGGSA